MPVGGGGRKNKMTKISAKASSSSVVVTPSRDPGLVSVPGQVLMPTGTSRNTFSSDGDLLSSLVNVHSIKQPPLAVERFGADSSVSQGMVVPSLREPQILPGQFSAEFVQAQYDLMRSWNMDFLNVGGSNTSTDAYGDF